MKSLSTIGLLVMSNLFMTFVTLLVFTVFTLIAFKNETIRSNHIIGFCFLILAVYFVFKK